MKYSLSVRVTESPKRKDVAVTPLTDLARWAKSAGFDGLSLRASVVAIDTQPDEIQKIRHFLDQLGLQTSMVTGDLPLAINNEQATNAIRNIAPYLDLANALGAKLVRIMMHDPSDIPDVQRAADIANERGIKLCQQMHWGSLFETTDDALLVIAAINRTNFGVTYEPANLLACGENPSPDNLRRLYPHLFNFYFQNIQLDANSPITFNTRKNGPVGVRFLPISSEYGINMHPLTDTLKELGYDDWFTVHQPLLENQSVQDVIRQSTEFVSNHFEERC
jgi:sugar phosphate isomerase/epimerase